MGSTILLPHREIVRNYRSYVQTQYMCLTFKLCWWSKPVCAVGIVVSDNNYKDQDSLAPQVTSAATVALH